MKMTQPTQDTDITSSISPLFHVQDDALSEKLRAGNSVKKLAQRRTPTSFIMETIYSDKRESEINGAGKYQGSELVKSLGETFPWLVKFSKVIQSAVGSKNPKLLDRLLFVYIENMSRDVNMCYTKPCRAAKLKTHINETLIFFHLYWKNIKERIDDHNQYLDKISEILGMYFDMELKASRRGKDLASKIAAKLLTAMFIYLDNSEEHIFRILFRVKFITKNYSEICGPIFKKLFSGISGRMKCITDVTYVRYLLALKLWKRIKDDLQEKKKINELAVRILGQRTPSMNPELFQIIPKPPDSHKNGTLWLLQPNSFDFRKACDEFIKYELNERIISLPESIDRLKIIDNVDTPSTQIGSESIDRLQRKDTPTANESGNDRQQVKKVVKLKRFKPSFPKLRPGEVVFIDLTAENEDTKQKDGKKKKKKDKKKLKWLKEVSKRSKLKKELKKISDKTWIEKADAHSTEDTGKGINRIDNNWPISEDKVTESTQRIRNTLQNIHRLNKQTIKLNTDVCGAKQEKKKCDTKCEGCKFCSSIGKTKYTTTGRRGEDMESSENVVTSQTSMLNNDAMILTNGIFAKKECYPSADSFGEASPRDDVINRLEQEPKDSATRSSMVISESQSSYYAWNQTERNAVTKVIKKEPWNILENSTTDKNCDKIILTDSSTYNINKESDGEASKKQNSSLHVMKLNAADIPSTSFNKNIISSSKECMNETCDVSTTASILEFNADEQINVISGSTNETSSSNIRTAEFDADKDPRFFEKEAAPNSKKLFAASKMYKSADMNKNSYKNASSDSINNKLQHSLIHALSLDEIIQIGRDDIDSQSEDDEEKERSSKVSHKKLNTGHEDNDFFQIPRIQLCDDLTNDNEVESLVTAGGKSKVDEFENIDILDSILNGDMSMQDILEEQQHLSMNSVSDDTSNNMLGFFTEFFKQSEVELPIKRDSVNKENSNLDGISKSLPEGSLGMTGILNSLLDSDLTSIDSPPSDFMYSNVQTVDPRLIRKSPTAERTAFLNDFSTVSDIFSQKEQSSDESFTGINSISKKTKDQLFLDQKDSLNCPDLEEFGLNSTKETKFEMPVLEEELIQLPQDPLIDDTIVTEISPSSCESPLPNRSEIVNINEVKSTDFNNIQIPESTYDYSRLSNFQEFTSLRLKDIIQHSTNEIDHGEDLPTSTLTDFTPPQSVDPPQSPYTFAVSPTHSTRISRHTISANMLTPPPGVTQLIHQNNLTPPPTPQQNQNCSEAISLQQSAAATSISGIFQKSEIHYLTIDSQSCGDDSLLQDSVSPLEKRENCKTTRRKPQSKVTHLARNKKNTKLKTMTEAMGEEGDCIVDSNQQNAALHLAHVKVALTRLTREEINSRGIGEQKSVLKNRILVNREVGDSTQQTVAKGAQQQQFRTSQLQRIDFREFNQNKSVLIKLNGKTKPALVFERNTKQNDIMNNSMKSLNDDVNSRNSSSNIVYKLTSNSVKPTTSRDKPYSKLPKVVNFTIQQNEKDSLLVGKQKSTNTRCDSDVEISEDTTQAIIRPRCSTRRVKTQASKSTKELNVGRKNLNVTITEDSPSLKKRKIASKFLPLLENEGIIYAVNQQKSQEKHSNVIRRDFVARKDRTKKKVV